MTSPGVVSTPTVPSKSVAAAPRVTNATWGTVLTNWTVSVAGFRRNGIREMM